MEIKLGFDELKPALQALDALIIKKIIIRKQKIALRYHIEKQRIQLAST